MLGPLNLGLVCEETPTTVSWEDEICIRRQSLLYNRPGESETSQPVRRSSGPLFLQCPARGSKEGPSVDRLYLRAANEKCGIISGRGRKEFVRCLFLN